MKRYQSHKIVEAARINLDCLGPNGWYIESLEGPPSSPVIPAVGAAFIPLTRSGVQFPRPFVR